MTTREILLAQAEALDKLAKDFCAEDWCDLAEAHPALIVKEMAVKILQVEQTNAALSAELERVKAERDALRVDAERYRWLTHDHDELETRRQVNTIAESIDIRGKGNTDAAIDAARGRE